MNDSSVKRNDPPRTGDGLKPLFSKSLNRIANIGDLMSETIKKGNKVVTIYFKPATRVLYVPNGSINERQARERGVALMKMFNEPFYDAQMMLDKNLIEFQYRDGFIKRTNELMEHFISEWQG